MSQHIEYRGRFAPSPTGALHFGSMVAAVGSYLQARQQGGRWLVRMEDLDPPRETPGAAAAILRALERFGLHWDEHVLYQSQRSEVYRTALQGLSAQGRVYACGCSRREIAANAIAGRYGPIYQGMCRDGLAKDKQPRALRVLTHDTPISFDDALLGHFEQRIESEIGDFVVRRADRLFAYQLAVVVDDAEQHITEVVRGADLLDNTPRQIHLQRLLGVPTPRYAHLPVAVTVDGQKLSKQTGAASIHEQRPQTVLVQVLRFLNQQPPRELVDAQLDELWHWAITHWRLEQVPRKNQPASLFQT
ncbi:glutamyl-Q tRNA(Asp) ligase [Candidatus Tenderia electrophaga]|jgi:glutamyl-Q tRNA(Asp) synthetase|uniref:Glutamyl-Q tRNA(Asp) synthetase n=1 Tax=Candidatus Tenderia electrophaga TaxID=1748243 RepID=A0A0S2THQ4_9GAMM|nr:glutamyl-Q tRNA(Asp) ligase [Candidatus Tenderia electrophaga]